MPVPVRAAAAFAAGVALVAGACDTDDGRQLREPTSEQRAAATTTSTSTSTTLAAGAPEPVVTATLAPTTSVEQAFSLQVPWPAGGAIDARFTCDGDDRSPLLIWTAPPAGTVELALLVTDDDAGGFVHWAVAGIPPSSGENGEGATITGALEGLNDFGNTGWGGPCPPAGAAHTYRFSLYALGQQAEVPDDFTGDELLAVAGSAALAIAEATGTYARA